MSDRMWLDDSETFSGCVLRRDEPLSGPTNRELMAMHDVVVERQVSLAVFTLGHVL
jgi:hypothetical protein